MAILKAVKVRLTAGRIADFQCTKDKPRAYLRCDEPLGLGIIATAAGSKCYIFQCKVNGKSMRLSIGDVSAHTIKEAQVEGRRLKVLIDTGKDPRQVTTEEKAAKEAKAAALAQKQVSESVAVAEAWQAYIADRSASMKDRTPEWGEKHKANHAYFVQAGGEKCTHGRHPNEPETTRPGALVPLMAMRLVDLDAKAIAAWLDTSPPLCRSCLPPSACLPDVVRQA